MGIYERSLSVTCRTKICAPHVQLLSILMHPSCDRLARLVRAINRLYNAITRARCQHTNTERLDRSIYSTPLRPDCDPVLEEAENEKDDDCYAD